ITSSAKARDELTSLLTFSTDVRDIIDQVDGGNPLKSGAFNLTTKESDQVAALTSIDDSMAYILETGMIEADCEKSKLNESTKIALQKKIDKRPIKFSATVLASNGSYEQIALGKFLRDDYVNFMSKAYWEEGNFKTADIYTLSMLEDKYKSSNPLINFDQLSLTEKEKRLNDFILAHTGKSIPSGTLFKELTFKSMLQNPGDWKKALSEAKDKLTPNEKIQLVSKLGGYFGSNYNYARSDAKKDAYGIFIDAKSLLTSAKNSTPGGICRDIALAQTQFLEELGFKDNYVVSYKTYNGHHATVITRNPVTNEIVKFNYGDTKVVKGKAGTEALAQDSDMPDFGLGYRVYDTKGKAVTKVSNEWTKMLQEATGAQDKTFSEKTYSLAKVGFQSDLGNGNIFAGKTSEGLSLYGVSLYNDQTFEYGKIGSGIAVSKLSGDRSVVRIDQTSLYVRANAELNTPPLKIGPTETKVIVGVSGEAMIANTKQTFSSTNVVQAKNQVEGDADAYFGVESKYTAPNGKTTVETKVVASFYPELNHVASAEKIIAAKNNITVQATVAHDISENTKALVDTAVILRKYGTDIVIKGIIADEARGIRVTAGAATPLSKDMPTFLPGGQRRLTAGVERVIQNGKFVLVIEVEKNLDRKSTSLNIKTEGSF
ncbi:MAG: hypothetical protein K2Q18_09780, partial [Bdellovibrionales bacterium]|nr:hypothetical protein [Bdellovibrionales bacterium]